MKTFLKVILGIALVGILGIALIVGIVFFAVGSQSTNEEITFDNDNIPTIYSLVGERKVVSVSTGTTNGISYKTMVYNENAVSADDINEYCNELIKDEDFTLVKNDESEVQLAKESSDEGELLLVIITKDDSNVSIEYRKGEGELTIY